MTPNAAEKPYAQALSHSCFKPRRRVLTDVLQRQKYCLLSQNKLPGAQSFWWMAGFVAVSMLSARSLLAQMRSSSRSHITAAYGAGREGVAFLTRKIGEELRDTMELCGARKLTDISRAMIFCDGIGGASFYEK